MKPTPATYTNRFGINVMGTPEDVVKITFGESERFSIEGVNREETVSHVAVAMSRHNAVQLAAALMNLLNATDGAVAAAREDNVKPFVPGGVQWPETQ